MTEPTTIPAVIPRSRAPLETLRMTNISIAASTSSRMNNCASDPAGRVVLSEACAGKSPRNSRLAATAPKLWLTM